MSLGSKINRKIENLTGFRIKKYLPRPSVKFAKSHFKGPITAVEVGTFRGEHAKSLLKTLNLQTLFLVDPYKGNNEYDQKELDQAFAKAKSIFPARKVKFIKKESYKAAEELPDNLDFVYLDGDDTHKGLSRDLKIFWKKVRKGGILAGHDFWKSPMLKDVDVVQAVTEFAVKNKLKLNVHQEDWWIIKK